MKQASIKIKNKRLSLYIVLLISTLAVMFMLKTCSIKNNYANSPTQSQGDTIDIGIEYSPLSLYTYHDTLGGFNYDLIRLIASKHNLKLKFHPIVSLTEAIKSLTNGTFDILIAEIPTTAELTDTFLFTVPIYLDRQVLVKAKTKNSKIKSQLDLAGDTVWVVANSPFVERIHNLAREIGDTIYLRTDSIYSAEQLFIMTAIGDIKQAVINENVARLMVKDYPHVDISTDISFSQFQSWLLNKNDSTLCDSLNNWIETIKTTPQFHALQSKYLN